MVQKCFCDSCNKEIKAEDIKYVIRAEATSGHGYFGSFVMMKEICNSCMKNIALDHFNTVINHKRY